MTDRKSPKRLVVDLPEGIHTEIKKLALERGITMRRWVLRALIDKIKKESQYKEGTHDATMYDK